MCSRGTKHGYVVAAVENVPCEREMLGRSEIVSPILNKLAVDIVRTFPEATTTLKGQFNAGGVSP